MVSSGRARGYTALHKPTVGGSSAMIAVRTLLCALVLSLAPFHSLAQPKRQPRKGPEPPATDPATMKIAKGFKVELLYSVPKDVQGSWVSMCVDPKGRLIVSDQYGSLYRVTPPAVGDEGRREDREDPGEDRLGAGTALGIRLALCRRECTREREGDLGSLPRHLLEERRHARHGRTLAPLRGRRRRARPARGHRCTRMASASRSSAATRRRSPSTTPRACRRSGARTTFCRASPTATAS